MVYVFWIYLNKRLFYFQIVNIYGIENETQSDKNEQLVPILEKYWQWWGNSPEDTPDNNPTCSIRISENLSFVFLQNSFETDNTSYDCTNTPISQGYSILFPLITSFCSQGDVGLFDKPLKEIKDCALNLDRGTIKGKVTLDGKKIVDISIDNSNGIDMDKNKKVSNNLLQNQHYKEIFSKNFIDFLVTNKTIFLNNWEKEDYKIKPVYYNGIIHCDCIILDTSKWNPGNHTLEYIISAKAESPSPILITDRWDFVSTTKYKLIIQ